MSIPQRGTDSIHFWRSLRGSGQTASPICPNLIYDRHGPTLHRRGRRKKRNGSCRSARSIKLRHVTSRNLVDIIKRRFENGCSEGRHGVKRFSSRISEAVLTSRRNNNRLLRRHSKNFTVYPYVGLPFPHSQYFLDSIQMRRRSLSRLAPLLELTKLKCAADRRDKHPGHHASAPFFSLLIGVIDNFKTDIRHDFFLLGLLSQPVREARFLVCLASSI